MHTVKSVKIVEVGPRDGLQNEKRSVATDVKVELIKMLVDAGLRNIEAASFVSPVWVPQMADAAQVMHAVPRMRGLTYSALIPNLRGFEAALAAGCEVVAVFAAASETFSQKNINCGIAESIERFKPILEAARGAGVLVRGYVSCMVHCPFEGAIAPAEAARTAEMLYQLGCYEISLGDTTGAGTPSTITSAVEACIRRVPLHQLAGHYHDTFDMALANIRASLDLGMNIFDSSVGGLGGCPYSPGSSGNVATEDLIQMLDSLGIESGADRDAVAAAGRFIHSQLELAALN
jgi:hydroxymethylglutaryl-CoA lyase